MLRTGASDGAASKPCYTLLTCFLCCSLMWACFKGKEEAGIALLRAGSGVAAVSKQGNTALIYAAFSNSPQLVSALGECILV